jgi:prepilin-type N-terminal cleavage/methylation domain-containing protein
MDQTVLINRSSWSVNDREGFTLIEVLFALSIILITMLGLYKVTEMSMMTNMKNVIRDEGVKVAQEVINRIKAIPFDSITPASSSPGSQWSTNDLNNNIGYSTVIRNFRQFSVTYTLAVTVTDYSDEIKQIDVTVTWPYKGVSYSHTISTMVRK